VCRFEAAKASGRVFWLPLLRIRWAGPSDGLTALSRQPRDVVPTLSNVESALEVLRRRIDEARARASKIVCDGVRQKHQRRRLTSKIHAVVDTNGLPVTAVGIRPTAAA
jgi:hypothetical protein